MSTTPLASIAQEPVHARPRALTLAAAVLLVLLAAVAGTAGWRVARALHRVNAPETGQIVPAGPLRLAAPGDWRAVSPDPAMRRWGFDDVRAFAVTPGLTAQAWIARVPITGPTLLPRSLLALLPASLPSPQQTRLAGAPAWTYPPITLAHHTMLGLTVQPTSAGALVVACQGTAAVWTNVGGCWRDVSALAGASRLAPSADLAFRQHAGAVLRRLGRRRTAAAHAFRAAHKARSQARVSRRLARVHRAAARTLAPYTPTHGPAAAVQRALRREARTYAALGRAAAHHAHRRYARARRRVRRADSALRSSLRRLTARGGRRTPGRASPRRRTRGRPRPAGPTPAG